MDIEIECGSPYFHFSTLACIMLNGSNDKADTIEQIKEGVNATSSEARQMRVQILPLPILDCVTLASY